MDLASPDDRRRYSLLPSGMKRIPPRIEICRKAGCFCYYPDPETAEKACYRTTVNTRYVQQFANLSGGSSVFTIPPNNGIQDIVLTFELPVIAAPGNASLAIPRSWGYALIKQISFRYGGSSQYFLSGQQLLQNALRKAPNASARDDLFSLGGSAAAGATLATAQRAYVWLSLPHTTPSADGKLPPLPSDLNNLVECY